MTLEVFCVLLGGFTRELFNTRRILDLPRKSGDICALRESSGDIGRVAMYAFNSTIRFIYYNVLWYV